MQINANERSFPPLLPAIETFASIGVGRTRAYQILNSGTVPAVKVGNRTMIRAADWQAFIDGLPAYAPDPKLA